MSENQFIPEIFNNNTLETEEKAKALEEKAKNVISSLSETFLSGAKESLNRLMQLMKSVRNADDTQKENLMKNFIFPIAHDLKGQGSVFGYPLLTALGGVLCKRIQKTPFWTPDSLNACEKDILDMQKVISFPPNTQNETLNQIQTRLKALNL